MNRMKLSHLVSKKKQGKQMSFVDAYSPDRARGYATKLFQMVVKGWGDAPLAIEDCAKRSRMSERSFERLMKGETKDPKLTIVGRVRGAYLNYCQEQVARLQHEIHIEMTRKSDENLESLAAEAEALAAKIREAKQGR
jgi:transcriptional regulator GlxA family with amidase domain